MKTQIFNRIPLILFFAAMLSMQSCKKEGGVNLFSIEDDRALGAQAAQEIANNPSQFPILSASAYPSAYAYLNNIRDQILAGGQLNYASEFDWDLYIIQDDSQVNAFCTPGGHIYVYTGLIKYLDKASSLAGVIGHEMAHADQRHSTQQLTKIYGIETLLSVVLGQNQNALTQIASELLYLQFSRSHETDADNHSVKYLCPTQYRAEGAADFFEKIVATGGSQPPQFLSTHPNPDNRVENIHEQENELGCDNTPAASVELNEYAAFKASLP